MTKIRVKSRKCHKSNFFGEKSHYLCLTMTQIKSIKVVGLKMNQNLFFQKIQCKGDGFGVIPKAAKYKKIAFSLLILSLF